MKNIEAEKPLAQYVYLRRIKIQLLLLTALIATLVPTAIADGGKYAVALCAFCLTLALLFMVWQDSANCVQVYADRIVQYRGAGPWRKEAVISWQENMGMEDVAGLFTLGGRFALQAGDDRKGRILIDSTLQGYKELLTKIVERSPGLSVSRKTKLALKKIGISLP